MAASRITELSNFIAQDVGAIDQFLSDNNIANISFDASAPPSFYADPEMQEKRSRVVEAARELADLLQPPPALIMQNISYMLPALQVICRSGIAEAFGEQDELSYEDIAVRTKLAPSMVRRIIRMVMVGRIYKESRPGFVSHTAASRVLARDHLVRQRIGTQVEDVLPSLIKVPEAIALWPNSGEPNHAGFNVQNGTSTTFFQDLGKSPTKAARFADVMSVLERDPAYSHRHLLENFPWSSLADGTVVDVGGSSGHISVAIAKAFPRLNFIVQDRSELEAKAADTIPLELNHRVTFMVHDFFLEQPIKDADVYFLRWILHIWSDDYAIRILRGLIPALKDGAKVVLQEYVMPEPGEVSNSKETFFWMLDIVMLAQHNGKERSASDWEALFAATDNRFKSVRIISPPGSALSVIEATWHAVPGI